MAHTIDHTGRAGKARRRKILWAAALATAILAGIAAFLLNNAREDTAVYDLWDYSIRVPAAWTEMAPTGDPEDSDLMFALDGIRIAGVDRLGFDPSQPLPTPNHAVEKSRESIGGLVTEAVLINFDLSAPAAAGGGFIASENHLYLIFRDEKIVYDIHADATRLSKEALIKLGRDFYKAEWEGSFRPKVSAAAGNETAVGDIEKLLKLYLENYVELDLPLARDIAGYTLRDAEIVREAGFDPLYPETVLIRTAYTLTPTDPAGFSMAGGGARMDEKGAVLIDDAYAVVRWTKDRKLELMGFLHPSSIGETGLDGAAADFCDLVLYGDFLASAYPFKTPYIGNASRVRGIVDNLAFARYFSSMALQTDTEPYGLTVYYDAAGMTGALPQYPASSAVRPDARFETVLARNSLALFALIDNLDRVRFVFEGTGTADGKLAYDYERRSWEDRLGEDIRTYADTPEQLSVRIAVATAQE